MRLIHFLLCFAMLFAFTTVSPASDVTEKVKPKVEFKKAEFSATVNVISFEATAVDAGSNYNSVTVTPDLLTNLLTAGNGGREELRFYRPEIIFNRASNRIKINKAKLSYMYRWPDKYSFAKNSVNWHSYLDRFNARC